MKRLKMWEREWNRGRLRWGNQGREREAKRSSGPILYQESDGSVVIGKCELTFYGHKHLYKIAHFIATNISIKHRLICKLIANNELNKLWLYEQYFIFLLNFHGKRLRTTIDIKCLYCMHISIYSVHSGNAILCILFTQ